MMTVEPRFDILGFGAVAVDDLLYVDDYPPVDQKVRVHHRDRQGGGNCATALVAAARLGARCAYVGALGDDELSRWVIENFARENVDTAYRAQRADGRPFHSTIVVERTTGRRTVFASNDGFSGADPELPTPELIAAARMLLVDHHGVEGSIRAARIARETGVAVVADIERDPGGPFAELLDVIGHLVVSEAFAQRWTGEPDTARATKKLFCPERQVVVVTCGARGCWFAAAEDARPEHVPAFEVDVVDTTGCGDVFHGAYCAALAEGKDLGHRVVWASATAALKATQHGGQAGCPTRVAVEAFLSDRL